MTNEELEQEVKRLEEQIKDLKVKLEEERWLPYVPYEVEVPEDIDDYVYINNIGNIYDLNTFTIVEFEKIYKRGLAFKTKEEAEQFDKKRILINKFKDWAKKYNEGWTPNWKESEDKFYIDYHHGSRCFQVKNAWHVNAFHKLPYFKTEEIAELFIKEFGDEIKEVLC